MPKKKKKKSNSRSSKDNKKTASQLIKMIKHGGGKSETELTSGDGGKKIYCLTKPPASKKAKWWKYFMTFHQGKHPDMQHSAMCSIEGCRAIIRVDKGTGGIKGHLQHVHRNEYNELEGRSTSGSTSTSLSSKSKSQDVEDNQSTLPFVKQRSTAEQKKIFRAKATFFAIDQAQPFSLFGKASFRAMFSSFHPDADKIVQSANPKSIREGVARLGELAKAATHKEMKGKVGNWTTDHWTGPNNETYSTTTWHSIDDDWRLQNILLDLKVFKGRTTGELIFQDQKKVLEGVTEKPLVLMAVTDTTGNMGVLGDKLRKDGWEHGYCTDHSMQRNAILAYDGKCSCLVHIYCNCIYCSSSSHFISDNNLPGAEGTMKIARGVCEYFDKSTQAMDKLIKIQQVGEIARYTNQAKPKKVLQDVITRWWSTWRMSKRLRWLRPAIGALHGAQEITCEVPSDTQWEILYQVELTLQTMAGFQRMLEGDCYVTGSMVVFAVFQIRRAYVTVMEHDATLQPVKELTKILLKDWDSRYHPADEAGKVKYESEVSVGFRNRYTGVHPYYFIASYLDPRVKHMLYGEDDDDDEDEDEYFMTEEDYKKLRGDILKIMFDERKKMAEETSVERQAEDGNKTTESSEQVSIVSYDVYHVSYIISLH